MVKYLFLFGLGFVLDFVWAAYTKAVAGNRALAGASWSVGIYLLGGVSAISYIDDHWALLPLAAGSFLGTYVCLKRSETKPAPPDGGA